MRLLTKQPNTNTLSANNDSISKVFIENSHKKNTYTNIINKMQAPVATILNDLSPIPVAGSKITNQEPTAAANLSPPPSHHMTPKGLQDNSPDVKAMR